MHMHMHMCMCMHMYLTSAQHAHVDMWMERRGHTSIDTHTESGLLHSTLYFTHNVHTLFRAPRALRITDHAHLFC